MMRISRRQFALSSAMLAASTLLPRAALAQQSVRSVTTSLGTYDIPADPLRVVAIDSRVDLQPTLAIGLPVVGYAHSVPGKWVPIRPDLVFYGSIVNLEQVLASEPDLIICSDYDPDSEYWPLNKLKAIAPVLPMNGDQHWKQSLADLAGWTARQGAADAALAEYDALIADIKTRHADKIATRTVVSVQPDGAQVYPSNGSTQLQTLVLADLGAKTIPPAADQKYQAEAVSAENFADVLGNVDGFLLATLAPEDRAGLDKEPLWQRLPAVEAGAVVASEGNINYGSIYSATQVARLLDQLYGLMA